MKGKKMKKISQTLILGGANLLALGVSPHDATVLQPSLKGTPQSNQTQNMSAADLRAVEGAHLEVHAACKLGHAAFDPVVVGEEVLSATVTSLYGQMA